MFLKKDNSICIPLIKSHEVAWTPIANYFNQAFSRAAPPLSLSSQMDRWSMDHGIAIKQPPQKKQRKWTHNPSSWRLGWALQALLSVARKLKD